MLAAVPASFSTSHLELRKEEKALHLTADEILIQAKFLLWADAVFTLKIFFLIIKEFIKNK